MYSIKKMLISQLNTLNFQVLQIHNNELKLFLKFQDMTILFHLSNTANSARK